MPLCRTNHGRAAARWRHFALLRNGNEFDTTFKAPLGHQRNHYLIENKSVIDNYSIEINEILRWQLISLR